MQPSPAARARTAARGLAARGVVAFAHVDWQGTWYSRHQILSRLARTCRVVVVDNPLEARDVLAGRAASRPALQAIEPGLWSYRAPRLLAHLYRPASAGRALEALRALHLRASLRRLGLEDPVHYVWHPDYADLLVRLPRRFTVYHCYDKYDAYHGADVENARRLEHAVVQRADLVLASSRILAKDLEQRTGHPARQIPHAVDFEFFRERVRRDPVPADLAGLPRPRVGFVARLDERIDDGVLREIALARPGWSVVIVGAVGFQSPEGRERFRALTTLPNVHALGARPRETIPAYTAGLDVCLLCYRSDNWGRWVQPIKAYEYLACGKPVVSAPIDAASDFGDLIRVVAGPDQWVTAIEALLSADNADAVARRVEFARRNTWDLRVGELVSLMEERLAGQQPLQFS